MKKQVHSRILLFLFSIMLVLMVIPTANATIYYTEDFEDDTADSNPDDSWYTYTESGFQISDVTTNSSRDGTNGFLIFDDVTADAYSLFTIDTTTYYDTFIFYLNVSQANHNHLAVFFNDSGGQALAKLEINANTFWFNNTNNPIYNSTYANNLWYRFTVDLNLTTDRIGIYIYNVTAGSAVGSGWGAMEDGAGTYTDFKTVKFFSTSGGTCWVGVDDMQLAYTHINPNQAIQDSTVGAVTALFAVAVLLQIIAFAYAGQVNPYSLAMLLVTIILGVITLMIVSGV